MTYDVGQRDRWAVALRDGGMTYAEIGRRIGVTGERVKQICAKIKVLEMMGEVHPFYERLGCREANLLLRHGIDSAETLALVPDEYLLTFYQMGPKRLRQIRAEYGESEVKELEE